MAKKKALLPLPFELEEVIFGGSEWNFQSERGDFNLQSFTNGKSWRLRLLALSLRSFIEYITHLEEIFTPWLGSPMKQIIEFPLALLVRQKTYKN